MKNEKNVIETLRRILWLKQELNEITELKEKAFEVFEDKYGLEKMESNFNDYWKKVICWTDNVHNIEKHFGRLSLQEWGTIKAAFKNVQTASINRKEFADTLAESREKVEKYIKELEAEISQEQEHLNELYDEFAQNSEYSFIFTAPQIKQSIIDNFLQS